MSARIPPQDIEAEQAVLGAAQLEREAITAVASMLRPEDFSQPRHRTIYREILDLFGRDEPVDPVTLGRRLTEHGQLDNAGGHTYLTSLLNAVPSTANVEYYAGIVLETAKRRALIATGTRIATLGQTDASVEEAIAEAERLVLEIRSGRASDVLVTAPDLIRIVIERAEAASRTPAGDVPGVPYPPTLDSLNEATAGQYPGEVIVGQATSGNGKTALLGQCWVHAAASRGGALLCVNEMEHGDLGLRVLASAANVDALAVRRGRATDDEWKRLSREAGPLTDLPFAIADRCFTFLDIRAAAHRAQALFANRGGLQWLGVDWLQLLAYGAGKFENRTQELDAIMRGLKALAARLHVPVMIASQPDKASYGAKLSLGSGRGTGMIAFVAHTLLSIEPWDARGRPVPLGHSGWPATITVEKARMGQGNRQVVQECWFDAPRTRFIGLDAWTERHTHRTGRETAST